MRFGNGERWPCSWCGRRRGLSKLRRLPDRDGVLTDVLVCDDTPDCYEGKCA